MKELSKFKVLGITLLVTMSSCVGGTLDLNAERLTTLGLEFSIDTLDSNSVNKNKKARLYSHNKLGINNIIESGRNNKLIKGFDLNHLYVSAKINFLLFELPQVNKLIKIYHLNSLNAYKGSLFINRAGPSIIS